MLRASRSLLSSTGGVSAKFEVPFEGVNIQFKRTTVVDPIGAIMGERPTVFDMQNQTLFALALGRVIVINTDIFRLVTKIQSDDDGAMSVIFLQFQLLGVPLESTEQRKAVALLTDTGCVKFADAVLAPATVQIVPMEFWEPWMNYTANWFLIIGVQEPNNHKQLKLTENCDMPIALSRRASTAHGRVAWSMLHLGLRGSAAATILTSVAYRVNSYLSKKHKAREATMVNHLVFDNIPASWLYAILGTEFVHGHSSAMTLGAGKSVMHEIAGSCDMFTHLFGRDISNTMMPCGKGRIQVTHREGQADLTWRFSPRKSVLLVLVFDRIRKETWCNSRWEESWDSQNAKKRSQKNAAVRPHSPPR